jgi:putative FmdB family regulatory protein
MPLYEYQCEACGQRFEVIRKFSDPPLETCTLCGKGPVQRLLSSPAIQFKGSGWYITDYSQKGKSSESSSAAKSDSNSSETKSTDTKKDATTPSTSSSASTTKTDS